MRSNATWELVLWLFYGLLALAGFLLLSGGRCLPGFVALGSGFGGLACLMRTGRQRTKVLPPGSAKAKRAAAAREKKRRKAA